VDELLAANERAILGSEPARTEADVVALYPGARVFHREVSVGALFGLELPDRSRVAVKVHRGDPLVLAEVQRVQAVLVEAGFPCPCPLLGPVTLGDRVATAEEWLDGERADARRPEVRVVLAEALRLQIALRHRGSVRAP